MRLALDTSTLTLSAALLDAQGRVLLEKTEGPPKRQSQRLPGALLELLAEAKLELEQVSAFIAGLGPGSFTGLRIGVATLKGFAWALKKPLVGVSSLKALALQGPEGVPLCCVAEVKKNEVYVGRYRREGGRVATLAPQEISLTVEQLGEQLKQSDERVLGPALSNYRSRWESQGVAAERLLEVAPFPRAVHLAQLADVPGEYDAAAVLALEPHYLRGSGAEENPKFPPLPGKEPTARWKEEKDG